MVLILVYIVYLWTQIKSTKYAYKPLIEVELDHPCESRYLYGVDMGCSAHHPDFQPIKSTAQLKKVWPLLLLLISTFLISICAKYLVESIDPLVEHSGLSKTTIGLIVLPLLGNAAELISAIMFASRKQMDLAFAVSVGSAIQIAIFITPLMVMIGWGLHKDMALHFTSFEAITLVATTFLFGFMALDDRCSPMKAALLCAGYIIIA
jgi:Ca2+:H+ antiporter